jgi:hypothetical protein
VVGIDCDNNGEAIISLSGAIHCITHTVGIEDPLMISHLPLPDTEDTINDYTVEAYISHRSEILSANMQWSTSLDAEWNNVPMALLSGEAENWSANIPAQPAGTSLYYYVEAEANSGKTGTRPMPAPEGWWSFNVIDENVGFDEHFLDTPFLQAFPNPASAIACIPLDLPRASKGQLYLSNALGQKILVIHNGDINAGINKYFFDAQGMAQGAYLLTLDFENGQRWSQHLMIK